jgi:hypothetical protein
MAEPFVESVFPVNVTADGCEWDTAVGVLESGDFVCAEKTSIWGYCAT